MDLVVKVIWCCGMDRWPDGCFHFLSVVDDCGTVFETAESLNDWNNSFCFAICPTCGGELTQSYDEPQLVAI